MTSEERRQARYERRQAKRPPKPPQPTYDDTFTLHHLYRSYRLCIKGVGWKASIQCFKVVAFSESVKLLDQLRANKWKSKGFYEFNRMERGKLRHIKSVHISERVVQRCLCDFGIIPTLTRHLIYDNGATIKKKGITFAHKRMRKHLADYARRYGQEGYVARYDIHDYFGSLPHEPLKALLREKIADDRLYRLTATLIDNFGDIGLGLGSQVSQISAVLFLTEYDRYVVHRLRTNGYARYMDDGYAVCRTKDKALKVIQTLREWACKHQIEVNEKKCVVAPLSKGVVWLKTHYSVSKTGAISKAPAKDSLRREKKRISTFVRWVSEGRRTMEIVTASVTAWKAGLADCEAARQIAAIDRYLSAQCAKRGIEYG